VRKYQDDQGKMRSVWENGEIVEAVAYDCPGMFIFSCHVHRYPDQKIVPGYDTATTNNLRLWSSKASTGEFDFQKFNSGEYEASVNDQQRAETISAVLYPNDK